MNSIPCDYEPENTPNAFGAPIYAIRRTDSTMRDARILADAGVPDGTVIRADAQTQGRGRIDGRKWDSSDGRDLLCTVILRRPPVAGFTLRVGLAAALALDLFLPEGTTTAIKWPNDILCSGRKLAGILCENSGNNLYIGTGFNIGRSSFPQELSDKAASLATIASKHGTGIPSVGELLEAYLVNLKQVLVLDSWHEAVSAKLYRKGEPLVFVPGDPGKSTPVEGFITGIGESGELLFKEARTGAMHRFFSGEIPLAYDSKEIQD